MKQISSVNNSLIKQIEKLKQKKYREQIGSYLIEGMHLVTEALKSKEKLEKILLTEEALTKLNETEFDLNQLPLILINKAIARKLTSTKNPQGIFALIKISQPKNFSFNYGKWVLLDNLADPGNIGTIIRTADAAGFNGVILSPECADLYNPKTQRSMQGSQFHLELLVHDLKDAISQFHLAQIPVYASLLDRDAKQLPDFEKKAELALIIGNEAHGVSSEIAQEADESLFIPILGQAESLNAAVAAGIMIYHFA